jgi:hypothetical protein
MFATIIDIAFDGPFIAFYPFEAENIRVSTKQVKQRSPNPLNKLTACNWKEIKFFSAAAKVFAPLSALLCSRP